MKFLLKFIVETFLNVIVPLLVCITITAKCQESGPGNRAWNIEIGGLGQLLSLNTEWIVKEKAKGFWTIRIGIAKYEDYFGLPHAATFNVGKKNKYFEVGLGGSLGPTAFGYADASATFYYLAPIVGYRFHKQKGFQFRVFFSPLFSVDSDIEVMPWFGISLGMTYNRKSK